MLHEIKVIKESMEDIKLKLSICLQVNGEDS